MKELILAAFLVAIYEDEAAVRRSHGVDVPHKREFLLEYINYDCTREGAREKLFEMIDAHQYGSFEEFIDHQADLVRGF